MKRIPSILIVLSLLFAFGCRGESSSPGLAQLAGSWNATYSLLDATGVRVTSGRLIVKQPDPDTITFGESSSVVTGVGQFGVPRTETRSFDVTLKRAGRSDQYLLNLTVDSHSVLHNFPLSYSETNGFSGQGAVTINEKEQAMTVSIKKEDSGFIWKIESPQSSEHKRSYEFEFKEKSSAGN